MVKEIQLRTFDGWIAHTTIVMMRYNLLLYQQRKDLDLRFYNDAFREFFDELSNLNFIDTLSRILISVKEQIKKSVRLSETTGRSIIDIIMLF